MCMVIKKNIIIFFSVVFYITLVQCGDSSSKGSNKITNKVILAFEKASQEYKIPQRILMAVAYHESMLNVSKFNMIYGSDKKISVSCDFCETAFGLSKQTLGLDNSPVSDELLTQIDAYAKWVRYNLDQKGLDDTVLPKDLKSNDDIIYWLWNLALLHRNGDEARKNLRIFFVKGVLEILNSGFTLQDPQDGTIITLEKENPKIEFDDMSLNEFSPNVISLLKISDDVAQISNARQYGLLKEPDTSIRNQPTHIEVIHCPLNLSACLELQYQKDSNVVLGAHYVIPQNNLIVPKPMQIANHEHVVKLINNEGKVSIVKDAIVIMLVGNSGRYVDGIRTYSNPIWLNAWQLSKLSAVIRNVCNVLAQNDTNIDEKTCVTPEVRNGVYFHHKGSRLNYFWGDIPDFDKSVFYSHLSSSDGNLSGDMDIVFSKNPAVFDANSNIDFTVYIQPGTKWIRLDRAIKCANGQVVWETIRSEPIVGKEKTKQLSLNILDSGPNNDGSHFIRAMSYNSLQELNGWIFKNLIIQNYDPKFIPPALACFNLDTY